MKKRIKTILNNNRQGFIKKSLLVILALALVIILMTGKKTLDKNQGNNERVSEEDSIIKIGDNIENPFGNRKYFHTLERALDFVEFIPQLPKDRDYKFSPIILKEKQGSKELQINLKYDTDKTHLRMLRITASKDNIIPDDILRLTKDKKIAGIKGKENASGDENKFYWERKGVYYILEHGLEDEELAKVVKSFSNLSKDEIKEAKVNGGEEKVYIYRDKDFEKAVEILGFTPKLIEKVEAYEISRAEVDRDISVHDSAPYYSANYHEVNKNMGMEIRISRELEESNRERTKEIKIGDQQIDFYEEEQEPGQYIYKYIWKENDLFTIVRFTGNTGNEGFKNVDEEYRERVIKKILEY